jgi:hypothetical protein
VWCVHAGGANLTETATVIRPLSSRAWPGKRRPSEPASAFPAAGRSKVRLPKYVCVLFRHHAE